MNTKNYWKSHRETTTFYTVFSLLRYINLGSCQADWYRSLYTLCGCGCGGGGGFASSV